MYRQTCAVILAGFNLATCPDISTDAVLRGIKGNELHLWGSIQNINGRTELRVHARRISHKSDTLALQTGKTAIPEDFNSRFDAGRKADGYQQ